MTITDNGDPLYARVKELEAERDEYQQAADKLAAENKTMRDAALAQQADCTTTGICVKSGLYCPTEQQAEQVPERRTLYECRGCGHLHGEKVSSCDCLENGANEYNEWTAAPKGGV